MKINLFKTNKEVKHLLKQDEKLGDIINYFPDFSITLEDDYYEALLKAIIGQQLSVKAANTIYNRFLNLCKTITPETILMLNKEEIRNVGISYPKIEYIKSLSQAVISNQVNLALINGLSDAEVINTLTTIKGIGTWTAEMFLIFSLGRLNVFSNKDLGLKKAMIWLYGTCDKSIYEKWDPYKTIGSLYLWEIINKGLVSKYQNYQDFKR